MGDTLTVGVDVVVTAVEVPVVTVELGVGVKEGVGDLGVSVVEIMLGVNGAVDKGVVVRGMVVLDDAVGVVGTGVLLGVTVVGIGVVIEPVEVMIGVGNTVVGVLVCEAVGDIVDPGVCVPATVVVGVIVDVIGTNVVLGVPVVGVGVRLDGGVVETGVGVDVVVLNWETNVMLAGHGPVQARPSLRTVIL